MSGLDAPESAETRTEPSRPSSPAHSDWLDAFRWIAAFMVLYAHTTNRFTRPLAEIPSAERTLSDYIIGFLSGFSHQAVLVFFVLSGYLVGGALLKELAKSGRVNLTVYFAKRFVRLWTVLLPTFLLSFVMFFFSIQVFDGASTGLFTPRGLASGDLATLFCNVAFLQTLACTQFASNGPLWSLFNEFWYYVLFALVVWAWITQSRLGFAAILVAVIATLAAMSLLQQDGSSIGPYALIWLLGVVAARAPRPIVRSTVVAAGLLAVFLMAVRFGIRRDWWDLHPIGSFLLDLALGILFANLLLTMRLTKTLKRLRLATLHRHLAAFSFSLYCIHVPVLNLIFSYKQSAGLGRLMAPAEIVITLLVSMVLAWLFYLVAERNTDKGRDAMLRLVRQCR